jgi:hypothetical protein
VFDRNTMARPVAIAIPSNPSHRPATAMTTHSTVVTAGHGETIASAGAKKNPVPTYQADPARSAMSTNRSQPGIGDVVWSVVGLGFGIIASCVRRTTPR